MALRKSSLSLACRTSSLVTARMEVPKPTSLQQVRSCAAAVSRSSHDNSSNSGSGGYTSPFQDMFDRIQEGKTAFGTTEMKKADIKFLKCGVPEFALRFKTTCYGRLLDEPFVQPNEHRVTLQLPTQYLPLNNVEMMVFKEIVGTRLNEKKSLLQLSSVQFGSRIENKRHVVSMLDRLVESAKSLTLTLAKETDTIATNTGVNADTKG